VGVAGYAHFLALAERAQWDEEDVDLREDARRWRAPVAGGGLAPGERERLGTLVANFLLAETAVAAELDPIIALAPPQAQACFAAQQRDEERHARFFARYAAEVGTGEPDEEWRELFEERLPAAARSGSLREAVGLYHMVLEAVVLKRALHTLVAAGVAGAELVLRDERWHIGFGVRVLSDLGVPEREILSALR
jgi:ribonucleoside-diphosphate reductase beta chain